MYRAIRFVLIFIMLGGSLGLAVSAFDRLTSPEYLMGGKTVAAADTGDLNEASQSDFVRHLNVERVLAGLDPVAATKELAFQSALKVRELADDGPDQDFDHVFVASDRMPPDQIIRYRRRQITAQVDQADLLKTWLASPLHRDMLMDSSITAVGLARHGRYWVLSGY